MHKSFRIDCLTWDVNHDTLGLGKPHTSRVYWHVLEMRRLNILLNLSYVRYGRVVTKTQIVSGKEIHYNNMLYSFFYISSVRFLVQYS